MDPIDVIVPLGRGSAFRNVELRFFLRSLERHAKGVRRVVIIGDKPNYLSSTAVHTHSPFVDVNKAARIAHKVLWAFENPKLKLTEEVLFCNDDYVFLQDFDVREVPPFQRGDLRDQVRKRQAMPGGANWKPGAYQKILLNTADALAAGGHTTFHYDIHVPIRYSRKEFVALKPWWGRSAKDKIGFVVKSVYGNLALPSPGPHSSDFKLTKYLGEKDFTKRVGDRGVISYADAALWGGLETALHRRFPNLSRYEAN